MLKFNQARWLVMPVYEYRCNNCRRLVTLYVKNLSDVPKATCTACGSDNLTRLFSSFAVRKTYKDVYEDILSDSQLTRRMMANDPRALTEWSRKMEGAEGREMGPEGEEVMERLDKGERWDKVVTDMQNRMQPPEEPEPPKTE
jgi:putative FmdB family regulatory protein